MLQTLTGTLAVLPGLLKVTILGLADKFGEFANPVDSVKAASQFLFLRTNPVMSLTSKGFNETLLVVLTEPTCYATRALNATFQASGVSSEFDL